MALPTGHTFDGGPPQRVSSVGWRDLLRRSRAARRRAARQARRLTTPTTRTSTVIVDRRKTSRAGPVLVRRAATARGPRSPAPARPRRASRARDRLTGRQRLLVHVDGGARGNPGPAAIGVVVSDAGRRGDRRARRADRRRDQQRRRVRGAAARARARARASARAEVEIDQRLRAGRQQLTGAYKVKHPAMKPLYDEAMAALRGFDRWRSAASRGPRTPAPTGSSTRRSTRPADRSRPFLNASFRCIGRGVLCVR